MDEKDRRKASTGTYRVRGVSRWVVLQALQAYGAGTWTPSDKPPGSSTNGI
jgi:hypothetical protein